MSWPLLDLKEEERRLGPGATMHESFKLLDGDLNALGTEEDETPGPVVLPISPVMGYAMRVVLAEYEYEPLVQEQDGIIDREEDGLEEVDRRTERGGGVGRGKGGSTLRERELVGAWDGS